MIEVAILGLFFWISVAGILYTYIGYPVAVWLMAKLFDNPVKRAPSAPKVSIIIACHNEERRVGARLANLRTLDYPHDRIEVIVVSDGSNDATKEMAEQSLVERGKVLAFLQRRGKAAALNCGVAMSGGEILIFTDARQKFEHSAVRNLVSNFADPRVGAVSGELLLQSGASSIGEAAGLYWTYERWIRRNEAAFDSCIGVTGAIYAMRRSLWLPLPESTILDDVYTPMRIAMSGYRVVFDPKAIAFDTTRPSARAEFLRKARTLTGNYQLCTLMPRLLSPAYRLVFQFWSHKLARLIAPLLFLACLTSDAAISCFGGAGAAFYRLCLVVQATFYLLVLGGWALSGTGRRFRLPDAAFGFSLMNAAAVVALFYFLSGRRDVWARTAE